MEEELENILFKLDVLKILGVVELVRIKVVELVRIKELVELMRIKEVVELMSQMSRPVIERQYN